MLTNRRDVRIVWGDCDPAGIVYYPRYFEMFDTSTTALFERALGMTKYQFLKHYRTLGYPMVDTRARFVLPTRYGDDVVIETAVTEIKRSSFSILHKILKEGALAVEGFETRVWVARDPADPDKIKAQLLPDEIVAKLKAPEAR
jgi:4-hydroxybenzoyl-CoA thioesterase